MSMPKELSYDFTRFARKNLYFEDAESMSNVVDAN